MGLCGVGDTVPPTHTLGLSPQAKVVPNNDKKRTYSVTYVPKVAGLHKVRRKFGGHQGGSSGSSGWSLGVPMVWHWGLGVFPRFGAGFLGCPQDVALGSPGCPTEVPMAQH